jgi:hypothetical protein
MSADIASFRAWSGDLAIALRGFRAFRNAAREEVENGHANGDAVRHLV